MLVISCTNNYQYFIHCQDKYNQSILMCTIRTKNNKITFSIQMKEYVHVHVRTSKPQKYVNKVQVQVHVGLKIN